MNQINYNDLMDDPLRPHSHEPNPEPPGTDTTITVVMQNGRQVQVTVADLTAMPKTAVPGCYIVSTGHGTSGPYCFAGVRLKDFIESFTADSWQEAEVVSADGFGNRVFAEELAGEDDRPIILAYQKDNKPLTRREGLVRMIVPGEVDDALRQVKWVNAIRIIY